MKILATGDFLKWNAIEVGGDIIVGGDIKKVA